MRKSSSFLKQASNLTSLQLDGNFRKTPEQGQRDFDGLTNLIKLDLTLNDIYTVHSEWFRTI
jgi:hypothetical protein